MPKILNKPEPQPAPDMEQMPRANVVELWEDYRKRLEPLLQTAKTLTITDPSQIEEINLARETRLALRQIRIDVENKRKELGEADLRRTQKRNADAKQIKDSIEPLEERLLQQEKFVELENKRIEEECQQRRSAEISSFLTAPLAINLGTMPDAEYAALLQDMKDAHAFRLEREKREAEEAAAKAKKDSDDRAAMEIENARLKSEADKRAIEQAKADKKIAIERRSAADKLKVEQDKVAAAEKQVQEARGAIAAQEAACKQQSADAEAARVAQEEAAKAAPDKEKLEKLSAEIRALSIPQLYNASFQITIADQREKFAKWIDAVAFKIKSQPPTP